MLNKTSKGVICFIEECRAQGMIKDELHLKQEELYQGLFELEEVLKNIGKSELYLKVESLIADTINLSKNTYFEYGENFESTQTSNFIDEIQEAV